MRSWRYTPVRTCKLTLLKVHALGGHRTAMKYYGIVLRVLRSVLIITGSCHAHQVTVSRGGVIKIDLSHSTIYLVDQSISGAEFGIDCSRSVDSHVYFYRRRVMWLFMMNHLYHLITWDRRQGWPQWPRVLHSNGSRYFKTISHVA